MTNYNDKVIITELSACMDGGSVTLKCQNSTMGKFEIEFIQNVMWDWYEGHKIPGRIYLNNELVEQRSDLEKNLMRLLGTAQFENEGSYDAQLLIEKINYTQSEEYIEDQRRIKAKKRT